MALFLSRSLSKYALQTRRCPLQLIQIRCLWGASPSGVERSSQAHRFLAPTEAATNHLAEHLALQLAQGDCYCLYGDVGAGKSVFSRAFIRAALGDPDLPVPSPTFLLQNIYDEYEGPPIHHFDLYRLQPAAGLGRLDLQRSFATAISLLEWADRAGDALPPSRLVVTLKLLDKDTEDEWREKLQWTTQDQAHAGDSEDEQEGDYSDVQWREICLDPIGQSWEDRLQQLKLEDNPHSGLVPVSSKMQWAVIH